MSYATEYRRSIDDPEGFWREQARDIEWFDFPQTILDQDPNGASRWFRGGKLNTCWLALDRHVERGRGDQTALIYDSPVTGLSASIPSPNCATGSRGWPAVCRDLGVRKGDRVIVYMPMVPEAAVAMLACARIGAVHSVVFGGFAAPELALRIDDATPKVILSASCGIEFSAPIPYKPLLDEAIRLAQHKPTACVILQRPQVTAPLDPPAISIGVRGKRRRHRSMRYRSMRPIRSISFTRPARPVNRKAWCATTAATRWR